MILLRPGDSGLRGARHFVELTYLREAHHFDQHSLSFTEDVQ